MAERVGDDEGKCGSVTSSQRSFFKNCPFAALKSPPTKKSSDGVVETDLERTEILGNSISPSVVRTPVLTFSTQSSVDSINDEDVFRTPPENASLSSAAESEMKPRGGSKLKSPSSKTETAPVSPSLPAENARVLVRNRPSDSEERGTEVTSRYSPPSFAAGNVRVPGKHPDLDSLSPISVAAGDVRVPGKHSDIDSPSPMVIDGMTVKENQPISESAANTGAPGSPSPGKNPTLVSSSPSATEGIKITETENPDDVGEIAIPFKEVIEALLRNNGENLNERDEKVSYIDILKQFGLKFP